MLPTDTSEYDSSALTDSVVEDQRCCHYAIRTNKNLVILVVFLAVMIDVMLMTVVGEL